jgi:hypothetical protein
LGAFLKAHRALVILAGAAVVAGCASHTGVVLLGDQKFMIAKQQATGFPGLGNMKAEIIAEGTAHCLSMGATFQLLESKESSPPYILGNYPRSEITFRCTPARPSRPAPTKKPDVDA